MSKRLELRFSNEDGRNVTVGLDHPEESLDEQTVEAAMDTVISTNIFHSSGGDLVEKRDARIVERTVDTVYEG
ncbi:DUF2922 domain-containing protein [Alteribacillus bidgolensis]|uniref:DUF2922 domain-containing protein n=1 Tax=Alteribacillus bidgolensis TaxID=930129 RepID=A0A1G8MME4_9BACI|nr:DUF2922 domain-containing protein [Alteribacillus bidgolensis]SDI69178.1 Protein of unknown function [Alteribacillus bidgolensis]